MTRKLTDEQVTAIKELSLKGASAFFKININNKISIIIQYLSLWQDLPTYWQVFVTLDSNKHKNFKTVDEAIAYAEYLLNQRYQWLTQQEAWIMSGVAYTFKDAGKVLELIHLYEEWNTLEEGFDWYTTPDYFPAKNYYYTDMYPSGYDYSEGVIIPADSPIWDAVKGVEVQEYTPKEGTTT
jgi:hypothetical protein